MSALPASRAVLVIPCYNEALRLQCAEFARFLEAEPRVDLLFVNDGSTDDTVGVLEQIRDGHQGRITTMSLAKNSGKGEAVRQGVLRALGTTHDYVGYWDADLSTPLDVSSAWVDALDIRPEIDWLLGARVRLLGRSIDRTPARHVAGRIFALAASLALGLPVYDTQCGAKLFRRNDVALQVFSRPFLSRWAFDVEVLGRVLEVHCRVRPGDPLPVCEMPLLVWRDVGGSRLSLKHMLRAGLDLMYIAVSNRGRRQVTTVAARPVQQNELP